MIQVGGVQHIWRFISDRRIPTRSGILLCKSQELPQREYSVTQLCSIRHAFPVTLHTLGAYGQWSVSDHNDGKWSGVPWTKYATWWPWHGQFEVGWLQPLQLWLSVGISPVALVLASRDRDICHVEPHPIWSKLAADIAKAWYPAEICRMVLQSLC